MMAVQVANLALRFLLELCVLAALGYWGFKSAGGSFVKVLLGLGAPLLAAVVWGMFGSPNASFPLQGAWHLLLEIVVFGSGVLALYASGRSSLAVVLAVILVINRLLMHIWEQ